MKEEKTQEFNFEQSLKRLDEIVKLLEEGTNIDDCLNLYEEGIKLSQLCMDKLENVKGKITEIKNGKEKEIDG